MVSTRLNLNIKIWRKWLVQELCRFFVLHELICRGYLFNQAAHAQRLMVSDAEGTTSSSNPWKTFWQLANPSLRGGWVIQEVTTMENSFSPTGMPALVFDHWFEAWHFSPGSYFSDIAGQNLRYDDQFTASGPPGSWGTVTIIGVARFYEDLQLPPEFQYGAVQQAENLFSTKSPVSLPPSTTDPVTKVGSETWH